VVGGTEAEDEEVIDGAGGEVGAETAEEEGVCADDGEGVSGAGGGLVGFFAWGGVRWKEFGRGRTDTN